MPITTSGPRAGFRTPGSTPNRLSEPPSLSSDHAASEVRWNTGSVLVPRQAGRRRHNPNFDADYPAPRSQFLSRQPSTATPCSAGERHLLLPYAPPAAGLHCQPNQLTWLTSHTLGAALAVNKWQRPLWRIGIGTFQDPAIAPPKTVTMLVTYATQLRATSTR